MLLGPRGDTRRRQLRGQAASGVDFSGRETGNMRAPKA
jgi:hypothetical protein